MTDNIFFLPHPKNIEKQPGEFTHQANRYILIDHNAPLSLLSIAEEIKKATQDDCQVIYTLTASKSISDEHIAIKLKVDPSFFKSPQAYRLTIHPSQIQIIGSDPAGLFYGMQTLKQIFKQITHHPVACCHILDWPDFQTRGVMLDISRDKVYTMTTLLALIDQLASWKINQIQLYTEHTFAYIGHDIVWKDASPVTPEEVLVLDRYCHERFIELVPNQNSFGHFSRWLKHPQYQHLAETTEPVMTPWGGTQKEPFSISPVLPESIEFITSLFDQLLPNFSSKKFNVGCDETFDIGIGKSKFLVEQVGKGQVYYNFLKSIYDRVKAREHTMLFWGDIILEHPELIANLPQDVVALNWGYEADHPFNQETKAFQQAGIPFYVCPGTSSWNSIAGRTDNMLNNIRNAAYFGKKNDAVGLLNTDWGDNGHWQHLPISFPGLATGAEFAWSTDHDHLFNLEMVLNQVVFMDHNNSIGGLLLTLGNAYKSFGFTLPNSSPLFWILQEPADVLKNYSLSDIKPILANIEQLNDLSLTLNQMNLHHPDAQLIHDEIELTVHLLQLAGKRALYIFGEQQPHRKQYLREINQIITEFSRLWMIRNRPGGLKDSLNRFNIMINEGQNIT